MPSLATARTADAEAIVRGALERLGGEEQLRQRPFGMALDGQLDLTVAMQGRSPDRPELTPIREQLVVDLESERAGYEVQANNYAHSRQHLRELRLSGGRVGFIDMLAREGGWPPFAFAADGHLRVARALPQVLLMDALDQRQSLSIVEAAGAVRTLSYRTSAGSRIAFSVDIRTGRPKEARAQFELPLKGHSTMVWRWSEYRRQGGVKVPARFETWLDGRMLKSQRLSLDLEPDVALLAAPDGIAIGSPPEIRDMRPFVPFGQRPVALETLAPGVHIVRGLRPGFRAMFVEFADHVVAIDAPAGWVELGQIPPWDDSRGGGADELGNKLLKAVAQATGGKSIRFVALTHHHNDHIGGVRPLLRQGATMVGAEPALSAATRFAGRQVATISVNDRWVHRDETMELQLIRLPDGNPKADGFLVAYLPRQRIAYVTAFFYPVNEGSAQPRESIPLAVWFIDWLDRSGLEVDTLYNLHAGGRLEQWQWEELRALARSGRAAPAG